MDVGLLAGLDERPGEELLSREAKAFEDGMMHKIIQVMSEKRSR
jgi:hypothetical protein